LSAAVLLAVARDAARQRAAQVAAQAFWLRVR
jgi:hypothetical protein